MFVVGRYLTIMDDGAEAADNENTESSPEKVSESRSKQLILDTDKLINPIGLNHHGFNMHVQPSEESETKFRVEGIKIIEPMQLYNILMKVEPDGYPAIADPGYLLLIGNKEI